MYQGFNVLAYTLYVQMSFLKIKLGCYNGYIYSYLTLEAATVSTSAKTPLKTLAVVQLYFSHPCM